MNTLVVVGDTQFMYLTVAQHMVKYNHYKLIVEMPTRGFILRDQNVTEHNLLSDY